MYRSSRGFTLIEVLVTISIIAVLAAMAFIGFKVLGTGGKANTTQTAMEGCKSMVTELEVTGDLKQVRALYPAGFPPIQAPATPQPIPAPRNVTSEAYDGGITDRYGKNTGSPDYGLAVRNTQTVMQYLLSAPRNQTVLGQLPVDRLLKKPAVVPPAGWGGILFDYNGSNPTNQPQPPILVDGWDNPIIFVPPAGLSGVTVGGQIKQIVTSGGVRPAAGYTALPAGAVAFWASAGPDGDFTKGDDNIYSFEN